MQCIVEFNSKCNQVWEGPSLCESPLAKLLLTGHQGLKYLQPLAPYLYVYADAKYEKRIWRSKQLHITVNDSKTLDEHFQLVIQAGQHWIYVLVLIMGELELNSFAGQ